MRPERVLLACVYDDVYVCVRVRVYNYKTFSHENLQPTGNINKLVMKERPHPRESVEASGVPINQHQLL